MPRLRSSGGAAALLTAHRAPRAELSLRPNLLARGMVEAFIAAGLL